ncbi:MAG: hypothetical protein R6U44_06645 [Archaeoglobaceae archaeon]
MRIQGTFTKTIPKSLDRTRYSKERKEGENNHAVWRENGDLIEFAGSMERC